MSHTGDYRVASSGRVDLNTEEKEETIGPGFADKPTETLPRTGAEQDLNESKETPPSTAPDSIPPNSHSAPTMILRPPQSKV